MTFKILRKVLMKRRAVTETLEWTQDFSIRIRYNKTLFYEMYQLDLTRLDWLSCPFFSHKPFAFISQHFAQPYTHYYNFFFP